MANDPEDPKRLIEQAWRDALAESEARVAHCNRAMKYVLHLLGQHAERLEKALQRNDPVAARIEMTASTLTIAFVAATLYGQEQFAQQVATKLNLGERFAEMTKSVHEDFARFAHL